MKGFLGIAFFLAFFALNCFGQQPYVTLSINPDIVESGDQFVIEIKTNVSGKITIDNLPSSFNLNNYQESNHTSIDPSSGNLEITKISTYSGSIDKPGKYTFGPAYVTNGVGSSSSKKAYVTVEKEMVMYPGDITNAQLKKPAFGIIQTNKTRIYEGEPIVASAKIYSRSYAKIVNSKSYNIKGAIDNHSIGDPTRLSIKEETVKGYKFATFEYDKKLIFPTGSGGLKIEPFEAKLLYPFDELNLTSSYTVVEIVPLPSNPPSDFIGGVGTFTIHREIEADDLKQGDVIKMIVTIMGTGNLQNTTNPALNLPRGMVVYGDPVIEEDFRFNSRGCTGNIKYEYNVQVTKDGALIISPASISYFDLGKEKYVTVHSDSLEVQVKKNASFLAEEKDSDKPQNSENAFSGLALRLNTDHTASDTIFGTGIFWAGIGSPLLAALLFLIFVRNKQSNKEKVEKKIKLKAQEQRYEELVKNAQIELSNNNYDKFYSYVSSGLVELIKIKMSLQGDEIVSNQEMKDFVRNNFGELMEHKVTMVFDTCQKARFGMEPSTDERMEIFSQLKEIISNLK